MEEQEREQERSGGERKWGPNEKLRLNFLFKLRIFSVLKHVRFYDSCCNLTLAKTLIAVFNVLPQSLHSRRGGQFE